MQYMCPNICIHKTIKEGINTLKPLTGYHFSTENVTPRSRRYGDVTATYIRRVKIPSRIYAKHQYM